MEFNGEQKDKNDNFCSQMNFYDILITILVEMKEDNGECAGKIKF